VPAKIFCADRVAVCIAEKQALRQKTGADAVEMESEHVRAFARMKNIPSATLRVILDTAQEDLPLDFNALMTANQEMDFKKLALVLLRSPGKIKALLQLQKESRQAAGILGRALTNLAASA
jgi:nucleoside phosphorylase